MMVGRSGGILLLEDLSQQRLPARALAAALRRAGLRAHLAHFGVGVEPAALASLADRLKPGLVVFSILFDHLVAENLALATALRTAGVDAHLTMTGPLATFAYGTLLESCPALDSVLRGEADGSVVALANALGDGSGWRAVAGLAYRAPDIRANPLPSPAELDTLPFPARDEPFPHATGLAFATVAASRGCPHTCSFCLPCAAYRAGPGPAHRLRSIPNLLDEIEYLYRAGTRLFLFDDEQFLPPGGGRYERVCALEDGLRRRGLEIAFTLKCRPDDVEEGLFRQLKALGLIRVYLGVEAGCQRSLDLFGKQVTPVCNARALALLDKLGIVVDFRCLIFHPWSTLETVQTDVAFLQAEIPYVPTPYTFREVVVYPGTRLAARLVEEGRTGVGGRPVAYTIPEAPVEILRRLVRLLFASRDASGGLHERVTAGWYEALLAQRLGRSAGPAPNVLRNTVSVLNRQTLAVWGEMLAFAASRDCRLAHSVNERAARWAMRLRTVDEEALAALTDVMRGAKA
jgi:radical SAM superfamily enzyme YgiQ (UPF0313 family)